MWRAGPLLMNKTKTKTKTNKKHLICVLVKYRITEMFLFFCIFGDRDGDSIVGIKQK